MSINATVDGTTYEGVQTISVGGKSISLVETGSGGGSEDSQNISWNPCTTSVTEYLANVTYNPSDYTTSQIATYAPATAVTANAKPVGVAVQTSAGTLYRKGYGISSSSGTTTVYNDIPGESTPFTVKVGSAVNEYGTLTPTGFLRWIRCPVAFNVRDLGGWSCDGGTVKYGMLFRGAEVSASDRDVLVNQCGVRHDINLRGPTEATWDVSPLGEDVFFHKWPRKAMYTIKDKDLFKSILLTVFDAVAHDEPCYIHCYVGCDRTGTLIALLLGVLGVSQSDIDKDYELSSFAMGTGTDSDARRRNESEWTGLISEINSYSGNTFRDKIAMYMLQAGITLEQINAFRSNMVSGSPSAISIPLTTFTINRSLVNAISSGSNATVLQYRSLNERVLPSGGCAISNVQITMGGVDITNSAWSGETIEIAEKYTVSYVLSGCASNNSKTSVTANEGYGAEISPTVNHTLEGAAVSITMGGVDVSTYYKNGMIAIPSVTGNVVITITAVETGSANIIDDVGYSNNTRISQSTGETSTSSGYVTTGFINLASYVGLGVDVIIRARGVNYNQANHGNSLVGVYSQANARVNCLYLKSDLSVYGVSVAFSNSDNDMTFTIPSTSQILTSGSNMAKLRFCGWGSGENLTMTINRALD